MSKKRKTIIHIFFILGIVITIIGRVVDSARYPNWLMSAIAPDYVSAKKALTDLEQDERIGLTSHHEGFQRLIDKWPNLSNEDAVQFIGRSVAFIDLKPKMKDDIELIAYDKEKNEIKERWKVSEASAALESIIEKRLFFIGGILFSIGIAIWVVNHFMSSTAES